MKATFVGRTIDRTPDNPALAYNGGDYEFSRKIYQLEDGRMFAIYRTSSDFDYCEVLGSFTKTQGAPLVIDGEKITVDGEELWVWASEWMARRGYAVPYILTKDEIDALTFEDY